MSASELDRILAAVRRELGAEFAPPEGDDGVIGGFSHQVIVLEKPDGRRVLVRLPPTEGPYPPYEVVREGRLLERLEDAVDVPKVLMVDDGSAADTRQFIVVEWLDGTVELPFAEADVAVEDRTASARGRVDAVMGALASVHAVDWRGLELGEILGPVASDSLAERYLEKWGSVLSDLRIAAPAVAWYALAWLRERVPPEAETVLVHGDFRLGNLLWGDERVSVLDWEHATLGDPLFDLAWTLMGAVSDDDQVMGLVSKGEAIQLYEAHRSVSVDRGRLRWWEVMAVWTRLCMEARSFEFELTQDVPDLRCILWQFGSLRTAGELLRLVGRESEDQLALR
jgi:aminoglycoside phosphotransferase (APT) family kinase protein